MPKEDNSKLYRLLYIRFNAGACQEYYLNNI